MFDYWNDALSDNDLMLEKLTHDEYYDRVQPMMADEFEGLEIYPNLSTGIFIGSRLPELQEYCAKNPHLHICSVAAGNIYMNFVSDFANIYYLAKGDKNPNLVCLLKSNYKSYEYWKLVEFELSESGSKFDAFLQGF